MKVNLVEHSSLGAGIYHRYDQWKFFENFTFSIGVPMAIFFESHKNRFEGRQNEDEFKFAIRPYPNVALMYRW